MRKLVISVSISALAVLGMAACSNEQAMTPAGSMTPEMSQSAMAPSDSQMSPTGMMSSDSMMGSGSYISYEEYSGDAMMKHEGPVVLFFNASWCPVCQQIDGALKDDPSVIPAGATIVSVDYDSHTDLRQKYGVTMQHTAVQIDAEGNATNTWSVTSPAALVDGIQS